MKKKNLLDVNTDLIFPLRLSCCVANRVLASKHNIDKASCNYAGEVTLYCVCKDSMCIIGSLNVNKGILGDKKTCQQLLFVMETFLSLCTTQLHWKQSSLITIMFILLTLRHKQRPLLPRARHYNHCSGGFPALMHGLFMDLQTETGFRNRVVWGGLRQAPGLFLLLP